MRLKKVFTSLLALGISVAAFSQSEIYPRHFNLEEVTLLDGPMKTAMDLNIKMLMQYDVDRLLTPYVRQAGLSSTTDENSAYYQWLTKHPNFKNWGDSSFDLSGHVGGHYLSALALAYAACHDETVKAQLKERLDYMLGVMKDCQDVYDNNKDGLYGFIGGQPINNDWKELYRGSTAAIGQHWGWVPFYCQHKILAGLRDACLYGNSDVAKEMFRKLADWSVNLIAKVSDSDFENFLNCEHGGMNESMLDAYQLFGDEKYLTAAKKYTHKAMLNGMQTLNTTFLDGKHANTQVPKYIGMERIGEIEDGIWNVDNTVTRGSLQSSTVNSQFSKAAENFWKDVAQNRTVCIGGNSVGEHFLSKANSNRYIDQLDGPESCNTNNMLKLSEMMADRAASVDLQAAARYADFYEYATWNHIMSTQDPTTGGYVYFTTLRPQGYRIYSQPNKGMWCCVGTGMENHSKYGHFIYTHDGSKTLYINLFTPSRLVSDDFIVTQETLFPGIDTIASNNIAAQIATTTIKIGKAGTYAVAVRHPAWAGSQYQVMVNGTPVEQTVQKGVASYVTVERTWGVGDEIKVWLPMELEYVECPNYTDYVAFTFGPILLGANVSPEGEQLQNEYAGDGRMDHAPGSMAVSKNLLSAPLLIGNRAEVLSRIKAEDLSKLTFTIDASREGVETYQWNKLTLQPFYEIHHARYMCYWYQQTPEVFANSTMAQVEAANEAMIARTLDFVAPGEQQSEAGHEYNYSSDSNTGSYNGEKYRDAKAGGYVQYTLYNNMGVADSLSVLCRFTTADNGRKGVLSVDGKKIADITIPTNVKNAENGFYNAEYAIPAELILDANGKVKTQFVVRLSASAGTMNPGLYYLRLMRSYNPTASAYRFNASDWTTGDANRISASNIVYDTERNVIKAKSTGDNNIALMMNYQDKDYDIDKAQKFMVVRGKDLKTVSGSSYLWWLNGSNHGTQVAPVIAREVTIGEQKQVLIAWNMATSGLYENFSGDRPSVCMGQTIFGLTSSASDGSCEIYDINFATSIDDYLVITGLPQVRMQNATSPAYTLQGIATNPFTHGVLIQNNRKYLK